MRLAAQSPRRYPLWGAIGTLAGLQLADALLTVMLIGSGVGREGNLLLEPIAAKWPVLLPVKLLLGVALGWLGWERRFVLILSGVSGLIVLWNLSILVIGG